MPSESPISSVSDTARWVAGYRAWESSRPDALFHDPYADRLAGDRGRAIAALMPRQARNGWPLIARTKLLDDLTLAAVAGGCDCVVNLAAELDTRPYRLELPASLQWIEADFPALIEEKSALLAQARPRCRLLRLAVDLTDGVARRALLRDAVGSSMRALVLTEGLLLYLDEPEVRALAADVAAESSVRWWLLDLASPRLLAMMQRSMGAGLKNAPMKFAPPDGIAYFEALGWRIESVQSMLHAAARFGRLPWLLRWFARLPAPDPRRLGRAPWSGVVALGRSAPQRASRA